MIPGGEILKRCQRPVVHPRHFWVTRPSAPLDFDCDGAPLDDQLDLELTAAS